MANPQPDKFTRISNEVLEALAKIRIPGESRQCLDVIIRKTWGFGKIEDQISLSQFECATGLPRRSCHRALKRLVEMRIVVKNDTTSVCSYKIQKDYDLWKVLSKMTLVSKMTTGVVKNDNKTVVKNDTYKRKKETITKERGGVNKNHDVDNSKSPLDRFNEFVSNQENAKKIAHIVKELWYWGKQPEAWLKEQVRSMRAWITANPKKANKKDWLRFIGGWLRREFDTKPPNALIDPMSASQEQSHYDSHKQRTGGGFKKIGDVVE